MPLTMARLTLASWETILRRSMLIASGTCPPAEYRRMVREKFQAMQSAGLAAAMGRSNAAILSPFVRRSRANAKRLRRK
ncbi:MAG TPA: hypothetical protein VMU81_26700 [Acetobacteraceae bacterium]|nr:hypothetical protein [Acetobacteraceae bacterium]